MDAANHACIGFRALGLCQYNPAAPAISYFSIGDAVAALALTLAVQQFLKPAYLFRFSARRVRIWYIYALCFCGATAALIAACLPSVPITRTWMIAYPIVWEIAGAARFFAAYGTLAIGSTVPLRLKPQHTADFARGVASFLSERDPSDYSGIFNDILRNLPELIRQAGFAEVGWRHRTAFFEFTYRRALEDGSYAATLLRILADREFCRALVEGAPWALARTLGQIAAEKCHARSAEDFVQEIARQALLSDKSIMAREVGYKGFSNALILTDALFTSIYILQKYRPFFWGRFDRLAYLKEGFAERLGKAVTKAFKSAIDNEDYWQPIYLYDAVEIYENLLQNIHWFGHKKELDAHVSVSITHNITNIVEDGRSHIAKIEEIEYFYINNLDDHLAEHRQYDLVGATVKLAMDAMEAIANDFQGTDDRFWHFAFDLWRKVYPSDDDEPSGMDPLQQRLAIQILAKLDDNMKGYYPAITRILLAVNPPYCIQRKKKSKSAAAMMEDALYYKLRGLRQLAFKHPDRLGDYLPNDVSFEPGSNLLTRTYREGRTGSTSLSRIRPRKPSFDKASVELH